MGDHFGRMNDKHDVVINVLLVFFLFITLPLIVFFLYSTD